MKYKIKINDEIPPSLNKVIFVAKKHHMIYAGMKKAWKKKINDMINPNWIPFIKPVKIKIVYSFNDNRRRDIDNYTAKFLLDGLTKENNPNKFLIPDDNMDWIKDVSIKCIRGKTKYTELIIYE
jgi:Holliday junction resolvase RusA-like endonuclease